MEYTIFHENVHSYFIKKFGDGDNHEIFDTYWNWALKHQPKAVAAIKDAYPSEQWKSALFAMAMEYCVNTGRLNVIDKGVGAEGLAIVNDILDFIGYERETEREARLEGWSDSRVPREDASNLGGVRNTTPRGGTSEASLKSGGRTEPEINTSISSETGGQSGAAALHTTPLGDGDGGGSGSSQGGDSAREMNAEVGRPQGGREGGAGGRATADGAERACDGLVERLRAGGVRVVTDEAEGQRVLEAARRAEEVLREMGKRKSAPEIAVPGENSPFKATVISGADGAKVVKNLESLAKESENISTAKKRTFLGDVADALGAQRFGSGSRYLTLLRPSGILLEQTTDLTCMI